MISLYDTALAVIDIETTDSAVAQAQGKIPDIIDIAVVVMDREGEVLEKWSSLVQPPNLLSVTEFTTSLTGISPGDLENAPTFPKIWEELAGVTNFNRYKLISWGGYFDYRVLSNAYQINRLAWPHAYPFLDAISMVYWVASEWGLNLPSWKLKDACTRFDVPPETTHRALSGAVACANVLRAAAAFNGF